ncbi:MAG: hypothetical protein EXR95_02515 [Gemmatimonadetes bacterium]|nr:hypothetical protein [Gemmatimonadota bacterium]
MALAGCFSYVPAETGTVPDGQEVRIVLTRAAAIRLSDLGAADLISLDDPVVAGVLVQGADARLHLRVPVRTAALGGAGRAIVQELLLDPADVARMDRRRVDRTRTVFAAAGAAGIATATIVLIIGGSEGEADRPNHGGSDDARLPLGAASGF